MPSLNQMVGQTVTALVPIFDKQKLLKLRLHGVESGGIWVESQEMNNAMLGTAGYGAAPKTPVFFLPYHQVAFLLGSVDVQALSEIGLI